MNTIFLRVMLAWGLAVVFSAQPVVAGEEPAAPTAAEIAKMLDENPLSEDSWPLWRDRYVQWYFDRSGETDDFGEAIGEFVGAQAESHGGDLPAYLARDAVAWSLLAYHLMNNEGSSDVLRLQRSEQACRKAIELDPEFLGGHGALAVNLAVQVMNASSGLTEDEKQNKLEEAKRAVQSYSEASPQARPAWYRGVIAMAEKRYAEAEALFREGSDDYPNSDGRAVWLAQSVISQRDRQGDYSTVTQPLIERFPDNGRLHILHAAALMGDGDGDAALQHIDRARELDTAPAEVFGPEAGEALIKQARLLTGVYREGMQAFEAQQYALAERCFRQALQANPDQSQIAEMVAMSILGRQNSGGSRQNVSEDIGDLCDRFPESGQLQVSLALALAREGRAPEAVKALERARSLGADPAEMMGQGTVQQIRRAAEQAGRAARPGPVMMLLYVMGGFAVVYAVIILLMAGAGVILAPFAHARTPAAPLPSEMQEIGEIGKSWLAKPYLLALAVSLVLFYVSVPFVTVGLLAATLGLLYLIFLLPRIPVQLVIIVLVAGFGMAWAVLKSAFTRPGQDEFGLKKTPDQCPRLHAAVREVAARTDTDPVDEIYLNPGSNIGVRQEGRGPFGMFGVKRRVLTLGLSTMRYLTLTEFKAILAHEYAHFSHRDTFYIRFIDRVPMSIDYALTNMGMTLGKMNYINPFFWFFWLYYKAYTLLSAGFSRSREFLADRMAVSLYGKQAFISGLTKVATDGALFEMTIYQNINSMLNEGKAFINMYEAFGEFRDQVISPENREKLYHSLLEQKSSMFATHPSFRERLEAVAGFPDTPVQETMAALSLFEDAEAIERELTDFLTSYISIVRQFQQAQSE